MRWTSRTPHFRLSGGVSGPGSSRRSGCCGYAGTGSVRPLASAGAGAFWFALVRRSLIATSIRNLGAAVVIDFIFPWTPFAVSKRGANTNWPAVQRYWRVISTPAKTATRQNTYWRDDSSAFDRRQRRESAPGTGQLHRTRNSNSPDTKTSYGAFEAGTGGGQRPSGWVWRHLLRSHPRRSGLTPGFLKQDISIWR
jgi:hypothetical protein